MYAIRSYYAVLAALVHPSGWRALWQPVEFAQAELEALGVYDDTVIALVADHGEEFHEHGVITSYSIHYTKLYDPW